MQGPHAANPHQRLAVRAREPVRADAPLEVAERLAQQVAAPAGPDPRVVVGRLDPVDLLEAQDEGAARGGDDDRRLTTGGGCRPAPAA